MKSTPATKPMPAKSDPKELEQLSKLKSEFLSAALSLSWQLALVVLIPVIGGFKIDEHFHKAPLYTVVGFVIAIIGVVLVLKNILKEFNPGVRK